MYSALLLHHIFGEDEAPEDLSQWWRTHAKIGALVSHAPSPHSASYVNKGPEDSCVLNDALEDP